MSQAEKLINRVEIALVNANAEQTKLTDQQLVNLTGLSSKKIRIFLKLEHSQVQRL